MIQVLDHGYVKLIEYMGSDERIIESARMSTGKGFLGWLPLWRCDAGHEWNGYSDGHNHPYCNTDNCFNVQMKKVHNGDIGLLRTLYKNGHTTPFEMCEITFEVQAPIFVFREWHRHRTQSYNEFSARYSPMPDIPLYIPTIERLQANNNKEVTNKQAQGSKNVTNAIATNFQSDMEELQIHFTRIYRQALEDGIPKELARLVIPVSFYSKMRCKANLLNWIRFLRLRLPENAQWEIRQYAQVIYDELSNLYPRTFELFAEEKLR